MNLKSLVASIRHARLACLAAICFGPVVGLNGNCTDYSVEVVSLPYCGLPSYGLGPVGLNESGQITGGYSICAEQGGAFYWSGDSVNLIDFGPATFGSGNDINSKQQIVGTKDTVAGHVAFLHENGKTTELDSLPGSNFAEAYAINESGVIVGMFGGNQAFIWQDGVMTELKPSVGPSAVAFDVNDSGQIVGWMGVAPFPPFYGEAFLWDDGKTTPLGYLPPGTNSEAKAISDNGQVCGVFAFPNPQGGSVIRRAFHWSNGIMTDLGTLPGFTKSWALDVNDHGKVIGYCIEPMASKAFVWQNGVMTNLNDQISAELNLTLTKARAINNNGQILCSAFDENSSSVAVLLTPIPSPIGDFNCDKDVDVDDLLAVINNWGHAGPHPADFNHNDVVDVADLMIIIDNWTI